MTTTMYPDRCGTHPPFDLNAGDRVRRTHAEAVALAAKRAPKRGEQTVRRHVGWQTPSGVWFVQDVWSASTRSSGPERRMANG